MKIVSIFSATPIEFYLLVNTIQKYLHPVPNTYTVVTLYYAPLKQLRHIFMKQLF